MAVDLKRKNTKQVPEYANEFLKLPVEECVLHMPPTLREFNKKLLDVTVVNPSDPMSCQQATGKGVTIAATKNKEKSSGYPQAPLRIPTDNALAPTKRNKLRKPWSLKKESGTPQRILVHRLVYLAANPVPIAKGFDVSHLCHNHLCCRLDHLVLEQHRMNWSRMGCPAGDQCNHEPKCLKRHIIQVPQA